MTDQNAVLDFWFGAEPDDGVVAERQAPLWWSKDPGADATIRARFGNLIEAAGAGELDWVGTPAGRLAHILVADQFSRVIHRGTPLAFALDPLARRLCREGIEHGDDRRLRAIERVFFYLPFEHSEELADQERSVELYRRLAADVEASLRPVFEGYLEYAVRHREIVARFGRFPHRNAVLGRVSTAEETAFLTEPGSSF